MAPVATLNRAGAWAAAVSLLVACGAAAAQTQANPTQSTTERGIGAPTSGRNAFIAPVVDIRIQDQGLALPKGLEEPPVIAPPAAAPRAEEAVRTAPPADEKSAPPPATAK